MFLKLKLIFTMVSKKEYINALIDTSLIAVFTILPTILGLFVMFFSSSNKTFIDLYKAGEFLLYSVSFFGSSYIVFNQFTFKYKKLNNFSKVTIILIVVTSVAYASLVNIKPNPELNKVFLVSIITLIVSVLFFYYSQVISNRHSPDIVDKRNEEISKIQDGIQ